MTHDQIRETVRRVNPVPDPSLLKIDVPVLITSLERRTAIPIDVRPGTEVQAGRNRWRGILVGIAAAFAVVLIVGGMYIAFGGDDGQVVDQATVPTATTVVSQSPVQGWLGTSQNSAGVYSLDGERCAGKSCNFGLMNDGHGSRGVQLKIHAVYQTLPTYDDATAVTVAGHDAIYRRVDELEMEQWIVDIEGETIFISLTAGPEASQADLDEAHAIIDSIRAEPRATNRLGFRLVFTLTTSDWTSNG